KGLAMTLWKLTDPGRSFSDNHPKGHWFNATKVHPLKPVPTITKTCYRGQAGLFHYRIPRTLTIDELKRCHSFPDYFILEGPFKDQWARIGNSVPPVFMQKVAEHVRDHIL